MTDQDRTLDLSDRQRGALLKLKGMRAKYILWGMFNSLMHAPISGSRMAAFIRAMQERMPEVFHVFGDDPEEHIRAFVPKVLAECGDGTYEVREEGLKKLQKQIKDETGLDLSHANSATWILSALFVQFRGSIRPPKRTAQADAASAVAK
jgi:hypothetical protein